MEFTFTVPQQPIFEHRGPATWLDDLARSFARDLKVDFFSDDLIDDTWAVHVSGDEDVLRFACVALNLHAEQTPWDSTPVEQGEALERVIAAGGPPSDEDIVAALRAAGFNADHAFTPSRISIVLDRVTQHEEEPTREVLLTTSHNREDRGWEAVLDVEGDQHGLEDGPLGHAPVEDVVAWVQRLQAAGWAEF